jgi:hypothetical protein
MSTQEIWESFCEKLKHDALTEADCAGDTGVMLLAWLKGSSTLPRRTKFITAPAQYFDAGPKAVVMLQCPDNDYRFDFIKTPDGAVLAFMECITLPVYEVIAPCDSFTPLPAAENHIRREKEISKTVYYYSKFKELLGTKATVGIFLDGYGESVGARSWVPFYSDSMAFIVYAAWIENRINGEHVVLEAFHETRSVIRFKDHIWLSMYQMTGHLRIQISYDEYIGLFEAIWRDRAEKTGWAVDFAYEGADTVLIFVKAAD